MGDIIQFPKKEKFIAKYGSDLPKDLKQCLSLAYDDVLEKLKQMPTLEIMVGDAQTEQMNKFKEEYKTFITYLLSELLIQKSNNCLLKSGLYEISLS